MCLKSTFIYEKYSFVIQSYNLGQSFSYIIIYPLVQSNIKSCQMNRKNLVDCPSDQRIKTLISSPGTDLIQHIISRYSNVYSNTIIYAIKH